MRRVGVDLAAVPASVREALVAEPRCVPVHALHPAATASFDDADLRLYLSIPQALLSRRGRGVVPLDQLDSGITAGMLHYNANVYRFSAGGQSQTRAYLGVQAGVNLGQWQLRHHGAAYANAGGDRGYEATATYVQRDIPAWDSLLILGDSFTPGELFPTFRFRGLRLATDDRMVPDSKRIFVPVVRGVARTNAKVTIRQSGVVIYDALVPPGPFAIDDYVALGYGTDLQVSVLEADGSTQRFSVPYTTVPLLLRAEVNRYSLAVGQVRNSQSMRAPRFLQAGWQHGFNDTVTGYAGINMTQGYQAVLAGAAFNTAWGGWGMDVTHARTTLADRSREHGSSVRLTYSKLLDATGTNFALASYWYSTPGFFNLVDAVRAQDDAGAAAGPRQRTLAQFTVSQNVPAINGRVYLMLSNRRNWREDTSYGQYTLGLNTQWGTSSWSLYVSRAREAAGVGRGLQWYATWSLPLETARPMSVYNTLGRDPNGRTSLQSTLVGTAGDDNAMSYSVTGQLSRGAGQGASQGVSGSMSYRAHYADLTASLGTSSGGQNQMSLGASGSVIAHAGGITLSQPTGDTVGLVTAQGAEGAKVSGTQNVRVDRSGYAVVPYLAPYRYNTVEIDPKGLPTDVEIQVSSRTVAPRAGAVVPVPFPVRVARGLLMRVFQENGVPVPFGAAVLDEEGTDISSVAQRGRVFVRVNRDEGRLQLRWGEGEDARCLVAYALPPRAPDTAVALPEEVQAVCLKR